MSGSVRADAHSHEDGPAAFLDADDDGASIAPVGEHGRLATAIAKLGQESDAIRTTSSEYKPANPKVIGPAGPML